MKIRIDLRRLASLLIARIKCNWYLLWSGMWCGECEMLCWARDGRLCLVAATTGSLLDNSIKVVRVFWYENSQVPYEC